MSSQQASFRMRRQSAIADQGAGPESILPAVAMDSGLAQERAPE
jgi:hypothetical protein